ncbi:hypothetical protein GCM10023237_31270 [Streptomyces coeruleoprunus]
MCMPMEEWRETWAYAEEMTEALREALSALGIPRTSYRSIRPVITHRGQMYVAVGMLRADAAAVLANALSPQSGDRIGDRPLPTH